MTYRSKKHRELVRPLPCQATFPHECTGWQGCEAAHSDMQIFGRGANFKSPDWAIAAVCHNAAKMMDNRGCMDREQRQTEWLIAHKATQDIFFETGKLRVA